MALQNLHGQETTIPDVLNFVLLDKLILQQLIFGAVRNVPAFTHNIETSIPLHCLAHLHIARLRIFLHWLTTNCKDLNGSKIILKILHERR